MFMQNKREREGGKKNRKGSVCVCVHKMKLVCELVCIIADIIVI